MPEWMERNGRKVAIAFICVYVALFALVVWMILNVA